MPSEKLAQDLMYTHSIVVEHGDGCNLHDATQIIANELEVTNGYGELLIQLLVDFNYVMFVERHVGVGNNLAYRLAITQPEFDIVDVYDLVRIDLSNVSQRLADQLKTQQIAIASFNQYRTLTKELTQQERRTASAELAIEKAEAGIEKAKDDLRKRRARLKKQKASFELERQRLLDMQKAD